MPVDRDSKTTGEVSHRCNVVSRSRDFRFGCCWRASAALKKDGSSSREISGIETREDTDISNCQA